MSFSGALTLTDLNDFITPSQACIKPVEQSNKSTPSGATAATEIQVDSGGSYYEVSTEDVLTLNPPKRLEQAQISLNDCLACSGCITSAESILITIQSHTEVLNVLESNAKEPESTRKIPIISIAPQSLASFSASLSSSGTTVTPRQILCRLRAFCTQKLGFSHVFDTTFARHVSLNEHIHEFSERKERHQTRTDSSQSRALPMLASACPGWICYAEKAHPEMLPFISKTKSPQQVMGTLVKQWMALKWRRQWVHRYFAMKDLDSSERRPQEIYHVTVMPCYDKKLEASRGDFYNELYSTRDVDCVLTTGELDALLQIKEWDLSQPVLGELDSPLTSAISDYVLPELLAHPGSSSGSYLQSIISHLQETSTVPLELTVKQIRNDDYEEYTLRTTTDSEVVFKGAKCYGFRNLQNVVRKVGKETGVRTAAGAAGRLNGRAAINRRGDTKTYDYIEVMACPGGCVNGGGQLRPPKTEFVDSEGFERAWEDTGVYLPDALSAKWSNKEWTRKVEEAYWQDISTKFADGQDLALKEVTGSLKGWTYVADHMVDKVLDDMYSSDEGIGDVYNNEDKIACRRKLFRTDYHAVESDVTGLAVKW